MSAMTAVRCAGQRTTIAAAQRVAKRPCIAVQHIPSVQLSSPRSSSALPFACHHRHFVSKHGGKSKPSSTAPLLSATLRKFYFLVHPDLFASSPQHRAVNEVSLQTFMGFITALKSTNNAEPWPAVQHRQLTFFVRKRHHDGIQPTLTLTQSLALAKPKPNTARKSLAQSQTSTKPVGAVIDGEYHTISITLSTNGGNCKSLVESQLSHLFMILNLPAQFRWDEEYFRTKPAQKRGPDADEAAQEE